MPKRTDLSAYKKPTSKPAPVEPVLTEANATMRPIRGRGVTGRPKKPVEEKRDQKVTLSFTKSEKKKIVDQAGLVPEATFLLAKLREAGLFK